MRYGLQTRDSLSTRWQKASKKERNEGPSDPIYKRNAERLRVFQRRTLPEDRKYCAKEMTNSFAGVSFTVLGALTMLNRV